jgi:hypothetical protein
MIRSMLTCAALLWLLYVCATVGFRLDYPAFKTPLVALRPETLAMLKLPLRYMMLKSEKYFMEMW